MCVIHANHAADPNHVSHLVEPKAAEVPDDGQGTDPRPRCDLSCHLQTDLYNLQRVGEDHLGATSLGGQKEKRDTDQHGT